MIDESAPSWVPSDTTPSMVPTKFVTRYGDGDSGKRSGPPYCRSAVVSSVSPEPVCEGTS